DGTWSMTFVPADFYGIEIGAEVTQICAVFNNGSWDAEGKDFDATGACTDFYIPLDGVGPTYTTWAITFTPAAFYGIAAGTDVTQIGCVFNNGTWDLEGKDWDPIEPETCIDFFIELLPPSEETMYADFEDGTNGPFTLHVMGCGEWDNAELHPVDETFFIIDNPYPSGINTSAKVMQFNRRGTDDDGQAWGGFWANNDPQFDVSLHKYVHVMVWKPKASPVKFKLEGGPSGTLEIESTNQQTETDKWVDMVFAFDTMNGTYPVCAFMPDFEDPLTSAGVVELYFDNIRVNDDPNPFDDTGIDDLNNLPAVSIAPNPCTSFLNVVVNEDLQSLEVYNLLGQQKMTFNQLSAGAFQFSTSELTKGIYIMVLRNEAGRIETVKFMKD
nr:T9SS type A sorting domain-containing protein [Bacteroidota bacterium]